jgi:hypothetical protein
MHTGFSRRATLAALALALPLAFPAAADAQALTQTVGGRARVFQAAGPNAASIQGTVDAFRTALGTLNLNNPGSVGSGRREINWDGVPDEFSDPNPFPGDFFNANLPGRARGAVFTTPGRGFLVSANLENPTDTPIEFGRINRTYPTQFAVFSPQRLFTALGDGNVVDVRFFIPGSTTRAVSTGFGAVFTDVDLNRSTRIEFFDRRGDLLHRQFVPRSPGTGTLSFVGLAFPDPVLARVRVTSGSARLGADDAPGRGRDVVVMDDFIFGEPVRR